MNKLLVASAGCNGGAPPHIHLSALLPGGLIILCRVHILLLGIRHVCLLIVYLQEQGCLKGITVQTSPMKVVKAVKAPLEHVTAMVVIACRVCRKDCADGRCCALLVGGIGAKKGAALLGRRLCQLSHLGAQLNVRRQQLHGDAAATAPVLRMRLQRLLRHHQRCVVRHALTQSALCSKFSIAGAAVPLLLTELGSQG